MRVIPCRQRSEEWERLRARPTASEFHNFITPARGDYSAKSRDYLGKLIAKRHGTYLEKLPTFWMDWGTEHEDEAKRAYEASTGLVVEDVGFVLPDDTDDYGGSPDGLVGDDGILEVKCPAAETLVKYHIDGGESIRTTGNILWYDQSSLPLDYKPQVQGLLMITGRAWLDFVVYFPNERMFGTRVAPDEEYHEKIRTCLDRLLEEITNIETKLGAF